MSEKLNKQQIDFLETIKMVESSNFIISITRGVGKEPSKFRLKKLKRD